MGSVVAQLARLQRTQLSVQALNRLCSVVLFLLASWWDGDHLPLVAFQGILLAVPYALIEALVGRPIAADLVPERWDTGRWARTAALVVALPVGVVGYLSASIALPQTGVADRLCMLAPVLLQLPIEAYFWATARTGSPRRANLIPQLTAIGTLLGGVTFVAADVRVDVAAVPAQVAVILWCLLRRPAAGPGTVRPGARAAVSLGAVYCFAAVVDLSYSIALPAVAGWVAGASSVVVLRAMDLAFGPFHVALSATTREDVVAGRRIRWRSGTRALTVVTLVVVSAVVLGSERLRGLLATDLGAVGLAVLASYCGYKAVVMVSTWLSTRHMIWAPPRRYLVSAIGSRVIAFAGLTAAIVLAAGLTDLVLLLVAAEATVIGWFLVRMRTGVRAPAVSTDPDGAPEATVGPTGAPAATVGPTGAPAATVVPTSVPAAAVVADGAPAATVVEPARRPNAAVGRASVPAARGRPGGAPLGR
ncbi:hypothetical protein ACFFWC_00595 [Plantactinospora siamensis]|uniref:O-antigen/teichoic acid export membrane protein n=1 Tax=Plantactinospora siamensis TaxID=555372 RepID=A0ABV6NVP0_9ACTN